MSDPSSRDSLVAACVEAGSDTEVNNCYFRIHSDSIFHNGKWLPQTPSVPATQEILGHNAVAGYIHDTQSLPVHISLRYYKSKNNGKFVVYWHAPGRYADFTLMGEYIKKRFTNCKVFTDSANLNRIEDAFKEVIKEVITQA